MSSLENTYSFDNGESKKGSLVTVFTEREAAALESVY